MSVFMCVICDCLKDADDGCAELKPGHPTNYELVCVDYDVERGGE